jgi:hypothetical protein
MTPVDLFPTAARFSLGGPGSSCLALLDGLTNRLITDESALGPADARRLAAGTPTLAVHHDGDPPFQPLPDPGGTHAAGASRRATTS